MPLKSPGWKEKKPERLATRENQRGSAWEEFGGERYLPQGDQKRSIKKGGGGLQGGRQRTKGRNLS